MATFTLNVHSLNNKQKQKLLLDCSKEYIMRIDNDKACIFTNAYLPQLVKEISIAEAVRI